MRESWIEIPVGSDFPLENIPFGICRMPEGETVVCTRIGDTVVNLLLLSNLALLDGCGIKDFKILTDFSLNRFMDLGNEVSKKVRRRLMDLFSKGFDEQNLLAMPEMKLIRPVSEVEMLMPVKVGDYTDFYSSREHAYNVGCMFRDPANALLPNWLHIPVGYHGRSSSIVVSGAKIHRPLGQTFPDGAESPVFGPSKQLDFELEMAFVISGNNQLGTPIPVDKAENHIFGMMIFNDLSARDIQKWEYVPLGPFLSKSFGSVVSPWIVTLDALEPFRTNGPEQDPEPLPYLRSGGKRTFDIKLEVFLQPKDGTETRLSQSNFRYLYWNMSQQLAHHTINGCNMRTGDMCASGTISGPDAGSRGSMLELAWKGTEPIVLPDGTTRTFLHDNDTVIMRAFAQNESLRIGFGESRFTLLKTKQL